MLGSLATSTIAWSIAYFVSQIFVAHATIGSVAFCLVLLAVGGFFRALVIWLQELLAIRASASVKQELREKLFGSISRLGPTWLAQHSLAELNLLATIGLDSIEPYFSRYLPQLVYTVLVTPVFIAIIWQTDPASGLSLLMTIPLIPIFMILIGWATKSVQHSQLASLKVLSQHFLEVLRGLTTLKIFGRVSAQESILRKVSAEHRERTMKVLRVSFLSGFALELISSLALALIAVSIGLRLLTGDLTLMVGLFVLLLAPEAFLPLRQVGVHFHASAEGVAAAEGILNVIDEAKKIVSANSMRDTPKPTPGLLTILSGPSGTGKSRIFADWLGFSGVPAQIELANCAWMPQSSRLFSGSISENIVGSGVEADPKQLRRAMGLAALNELHPDHQVGTAGSLISGGQAQRVCLARAFYRVLINDCQYLLLDEPISALDDSRAATVIQSLREFANLGKTVVAISHQKSLLVAGDKVIEVTLV